MRRRIELSPGFLYNFILLESSLLTDEPILLHLRSAAAVFDDAPMQSLYRTSLIWLLSLCWLWHGQCPYCAAQAAVPSSSGEFCEDAPANQDDSRAQAIRRGSQTAKEGFRNEDEIVEKINAWRTDPDARAWLEAMNYSIEDIEDLLASKPHREKSDILLWIDSKTRGKTREGISIKLVSNPRGFNQVDKRWLDTYAKAWSMPDEVVEALRLFVGEVPPQQPSRDSRRTFLDEMDAASQRLVIDFFLANRQKVAEYMFAGEGEQAAQWWMVTLKPTGRWKIVPTKEAAEFFSQGDVVISSQGSLRIGRITMQRKGGDGGRETANMLQFKVNPAEIFQDNR